MSELTAEFGSQSERANRLEWPEPLAALESLLSGPSSREASTFLAEAPSILVRLTGADLATIVCVEEDFNYRVMGIFGHLNSDTAVVKRRMGYSPVARCLETGQSLIATSAMEVGLGELDDWLIREGVVEAALEPMLTRMSTKGAVIVGFRTSIAGRPGAKAEGARTAARLVARLSSLIVETDEVVKAARTQAYHAELLNALSVKARRAASAEQILKEASETLGRGLGASATLAGLVEGSVGTDDARLRLLGGEEGISEAETESGLVEELASKTVADWGEEVAPERRPSKERSRYSLVRLTKPGELGAGSPPGFVLLLMPAAGSPAFVAGVREEPAQEFTSAEARFLERAAEEISHYLSHVGAFAAEREAVKRLTELDRTKSELISVVSHELRTPLTSIRGFASSLLEGFDDLTDDKRRRMLEIIDDQAQRLSKLIDDFLDMSKLQEGRVSLELGTVYLVEVAERVAENQRSLAAKRGMTIELSGRAVEMRESARIQGDEAKVEQILINLVGNAIKYGDGKVSIDVFDFSDGFCLAVEDEGEGVPPEKQAAIFDRFVQADSSSTRRASGVGLGLAIARGLAEVHGGSLWYEDRKPRGARFVLYLPVVPKIPK